MSIYKEIKNTGIDLFISYHPKVIQLKRESKILHKELKSKGLSLMQCQELTAKQNGFQNWYNFIHLIKRHYQQDLDFVPFILTTDKNPPKKENYKLKGMNNSKTLHEDGKDNPILLGYDINFGHYKWQNDHSMKTHQMILGSTIYKKYDVYLANQAMKENRSLIFFNGEGDNDTLKALLKSAIDKNRRSDVKIVNFKNYSLYPEHEHKIQDNFLGSSSGLTELFYSMIDISEDFWKGRCISLLSAVMQYLVFHRDTNKQTITLHRIKELLSLENFLEVLKEKNIPLHIKNSFISYIESLPNFKFDKSIKNEHAVVQHNYLSEKLINILNELIDSGYFVQDDKAINLHNLLDKQNQNIYIIQFSSDNKNLNEKLNNLFMNAIKGKIANLLGVSLDLNEKEYLEKKNINRNVLYLFIRSCYLPKGIAVLPAQARSQGLSLNFSYSNMSELQNYSNENEAASIIANTNTKIFSALEEDYNTVALLEKFKNEVSEESVLNIKDDLISVDINMNRRKNNHVWLVKRGYASQISFDSPYEPTSIIASENIKIFMKLEDPKETYDLFEKSRD